MGDLTWGAIGATAIAAVLSFAGLVVSKEQKTSEFRQAWIDSLRSEIADYLVNLNAISDALQRTYTSFPEKLGVMSSLYSSYNKSVFLINLRVNDLETQPKVLLDAMASVQGIMSNENNMSPEHLRPIEKIILTASKIILKNEWVRVKKGEFTFRAFKALSVIFVISLFSYVVLFSVIPLCKHDLSLISFSKSENRPGNCSRGWQKSVARRSIG